MEKNIRRDDWETLKPTVQGWGVNDVNYQTQKYLKGKKVWVCDYYRDWYDILVRSFSKKFKTDHPTYEDVTVSSEWKYLSNFIKWVDSQPNKDWRNCVPDKDLLLLGNKCYSPETVVYVSKALNNFVTSSQGSRGELMLGVTKALRNKVNPYQANCQNQLKGKQDRLGYFATEFAAHKAWQANKHKIACQLADLQDDPRVADALRQRYAPDTDWTNK